MDVFFVVVLIAAVLAVGVLALAWLLRMRRTMEPTDPQEH